MPFNGSGTFTYTTSGLPVTTGTSISSTVENNKNTETATGLSNTICKDGQSTPTANIPMGNFRVTNLGAATARTDAARASQVQDSTMLFLQGTAGTDTVTASATPAITAYVTGQKFHFFPANNNTGAATLNVNSVGAGAVQWNGAALGAGALKQNVPAIVAVVTTTPVFEIVATGAVGSATQTLTNKTLTSPTINTAVTGSTVSMGTGSGSGTHVVVAHVNTTAAGNVGSGEDDLMSYSLPANSLSAAGKAVRITAQGFTANNANAKTLKFYWGVAVGSWTMTTGAAYGWRVQATFTSTGANTQDIALVITEVPLNAGLGADKSDQLVGGGHTQTTSGAITIKCTGEATNNNDIVQDYLMVEFLN